MVAKHATVAWCTSKRRSFGLRRRTSLPVSAELGAGRHMDIWNINSKHLDSMAKMTPTCEIVLNADAASDSQLTADIRIGREGERGTFERRDFELRRHRPALVIFVRVVGTWQERFDTLFEHSMPQHNNSAPAHTWQIA